MSLVEKTVMNNQFFSKNMKFFFVLKDTWLLKAPFELINDFQCKLVVD